MNAIDLTMTTTITTTITTIVETAETIFTKAAEYCRHRIDSAKNGALDVKYADDFEDHAFLDAAAQEEERSRATGSNLRSDDSDYDNISTPDTTDFLEIDTDFERDDEDEDGIQWASDSRRGRTTNTNANNNSSKDFEDAAQLSKIASLD